MVTWRDDDVLYPGTKLEDLLEVDDILRQHRCAHTIAILASTLTPELAAVIRERGMVPQLHAWAHDDLSVSTDALAQLPEAIARIEDLVGRRPTVLYPPWNRTNARLESVAAGLGLRVSAVKHSLEQFIRFKGQVPSGSTVNFHFWHEPDRRALSDALWYAPIGRNVAAGSVR